MCVLRALIYSTSSTWGVLIAVMSGGVSVLFFVLLRALAVGRGHGGPQVVGGHPSGHRWMNLKGAWGSLCMRCGMALIDSQLFLRFEGLVSLPSSGLGLLLCRFVTFKV
jgi:hypothetical protein